MEWPLHSVCVCVIRVLLLRQSSLSLSLLIRSCRQTERSARLVWVSSSSSASTQKHTPSGRHRVHRPSQPRQEATQTDTHGGKRKQSAQSLRASVCRRTVDRDWPVCLFPSRVWRERAATHTHTHAAGRRTSVVVRRRITCTIAHWRARIIIPVSARHARAAFAFAVSSVVCVCV